MFECAWSASFAVVQSISPARIELFSYAFDDKIYRPHADFPLAQFRYRKFQVYMRIDDDGGGDDTPEHIRGVCVVGLLLWSSFLLWRQTFCCSRNTTHSGTFGTVRAAAACIDPNAPSLAHRPHVVYACNTHARTLAKVPTTQAQAERSCFATITRSIQRSLPYSPFRRHR